MQSKSMVQPAALSVQPITNLSRSTRLRVIIATPHYFPDMGGVESHVYQVARRLAQRGVDITVLTTDSLARYPANEQSEGVNIHRVPAYPKKRDWLFAPEIYRFIRNANCDVVHVQSYHTFVAPLAMLAARRARIPYIVTFHGGGHSSHWRNAIRNIQWQLLRPLLTRAAKLVAVAQFEIELYGRALQLPPERFVLSPNGGDITTDPQLINALPDPNLIISVGRLERYKGHQHVIAAMPEVLRQRPEIHLRVLGSGPYEAELQRLTRSLGLTKQVEIRGVPPTERHVMAETLSRAALVVLMSEYETHPIAALEAIMLQRSVLVSDNSGLRELVIRGWARAVSPHSTPQQLATAMLAQLRQPCKPEKITVSTWDECATDLHTLYQQASHPVTT